MRREKGVLEASANKSKKNMQEYIWMGNNGQMSVLYICIHIHQGIIKMLDN